MKTVKAAAGQGGFTLVEVMVALLVVAVSVSAILFQMMSKIDNAAYLRDKTIAHWVALNQLELIRLENANTNELLGRERSGKEEMAGMEWFWLVKPENADKDNRYERLEVSVAVEEGAEPLVTVISSIDGYHQEP